MNNIAVVLHMRTIVPFVLTRTKRFMVLLFSLAYRFLKIRGNYSLNMIIMIIKNLPIVNAMNFHHFE